MHIVRFQGGFANQLFQLCLYEKLKKKYGDEKVYADTSSYLTLDEHNGFRLKDKYPFRYMKEIPKDSVMLGEAEVLKGYPEDDRTYVYNGYWQDEALCGDDIDFIRTLFDEDKLGEENKAKLSRIRSVESVSVHVRRGDYVDNFLHGNIANKTYINNAIAYMKEHLTAPVFFVFSDDIPWCRENLSASGAEFCYITGNEDREDLDMLMMSECRHNVIANSSFSWWAQKLNRNPEKTVISPEYWFNEETIHNRLNSDSFVHVKNVPCITKAGNTPFFSILLPVYNTAGSLRRCLSSILNQSFEEIEVIAVDDGSSDESYHILSEYAKQDARLRIIKKDQNEGLLAARISAMQKAAGEYILLIDSDDYINTDACSILKRSLEHERPDMLEFGYVLEPWRRAAANALSDREQILAAVFESDDEHTNWNVWNRCYCAALVKRFLEAASSFYCNMTEDVYVTSLMLTLAGSYKKIDDVLYHYVEGGMSTDPGMSDMSDAQIENMIESVANKNREYMRYFTEKKPEYLEYAKKRIQRDSGEIAGICTILNRPISEKIRLMKLLDEKCGSDYGEKYEKEATDLVNTHRYLEEAGLKKQLRYALSYSLKHIKKRYGK